MVRPKATVLLPLPPGFVFGEGDPPPPIMIGDGPGDLVVVPVT